MVVAHAVFLKAALIDAGGHHEGVRRRQHAEKFRWVGRVLDRDAPVAAVRLRAEQPDVAAEVDDRTRYVELCEDGAYRVARIALGDAAEVELRAVREGDRIAVHRQLFQTDVREQRGQLLVRRHARRVAGEVPCVHHGRDGRIERPARKLADGLCNVRELGKLRVLDRAVAVERAYRACLVVAVELRVERAQRFLRRVERGGGAFAVGGQIHHRVHRVDRARLAHFLLLSPAAGGKGQRERHSQNGCQHTFCHSFLRKK